MPQPRLRRPQIPIPLRIPPQLLGRKRRRRPPAIHADDFVLFVEKLYVLRLPFPTRGDVGGGGGVARGFGAEEYEAAVAFHVVGEGVRNEALCDGGFHLADGARRGRVEVDERTVLAVHDEVAGGASALGDFDKVVDGETAGPGWENVG